MEAGKQAAEPISPDQVSEVKAAIDGGDLKLHTDTSNLSFDRAIVSTNSKGETLAMVPIKNEGMDIGNFSVVFSNSGDIVDYSETHFVEKTKTSGHITNWRDGKLALDQDAYALESDGTADRSVQDALAELNRCLSSAGIPAWVFGVASIACSFGSLPGYIACLTAAGAAGGTAGYCGAGAWSKL